MTSTKLMPKTNAFLVLLLLGTLGCAPFTPGGEAYKFHRDVWEQPATVSDPYAAPADPGRTTLRRTTFKGPSGGEMVVRGQTPQAGWNAPPQQYGGTAVGSVSPADARTFEGQQTQYQTQPQYIPVPSYQPNSLPPTATNVPRAGVPAPYYPPPPGGSGLFAAPGGPPPGYGPGDWLPPDQFVDIEATVQETTTGRLMLGAGINSDAGIVGNVLIEEQNFDITRVPRSWNDVINGTAFRGAGQRFRMEAVPGTELQRYMMSFSEPYLFDSPVSFGVSGFYYTRDYTEYDEERLGGRVSLGYFFRPDLSGTVAFRGENVDVSDPRVPTPADLLDVLGSNTLYTTRFELTHDTRNNTYLPTGGSYLQFAYEQGFGDFTFPKFEIDARRYFVLSQRIDGTGRQVLGVSGRVGWTGSETPMFEHFYAGGFSTLRGFDFRGASPLDMDVRVGGEFQLLTSVEYRFPLTADDMVQGSFFVDAGTVERELSIDADNFRVTPGFELRIAIPALGPVPLAVGLGVPIMHADHDDIRNFHFFIGISR